MAIVPVRINVAGVVQVFIGDPTSPVDGKTGLTPGNFAVHWRDVGAGSFTNISSDGSGTGTTITEIGFGWYEYSYLSTRVTNAGVVNMEFVVAGGINGSKQLGVGMLSTTGRLSVTADVLSWNGSAVATPSVAGVPEVNVTHWIGTAAATPTVAGVPEVDVTHHLGSAVATPTIAGVPEVDVTHWIGTAAATPSVAGVPEVDVTHWIGTAVATPTIAGVPEVDVTHWRGGAVVAPSATGIPKIEVASFVAGVIVEGAFAAGAIAAAALKADAVTKIANGVFDTVIEISSTFGDMIRLLASVLAGKATNFSTGTLIFKSLNGSKTRWTITTDETGRLTATKGDLT